MIYVNPEVISIDPVRFPPPGEDEVLSARNTECLLLNNEFEVIGNAEVYYAARRCGERWVRAQKIIDYAHAPEYPDRFSVEISSKCNYACIMCPRSALRRPQQFMDDRMFYRIVDDLAAHPSVKLVDLYRLGESTYHPKFWDFLDYLDRLPRSLPLILATNGSLIDENQLGRLLNSSLSLLVVSINALDRNTYRTVTGGKGELATVLALVKKAKRLRRGRKPFFGLQFVEQEITADLVEPFLNSYIEYADYIGASQLEDFAGQVFQNTRFMMEHNLDAEKLPERIPCPRALWAQFRIYSNGDVVPCICDINAEHLKMGNVNDASIAEIFCSPRWREFRELHRTRYRELPPHSFCGQCREWMIYSAGNRTHRVVCNL